MDYIIERKELNEIRKGKGWLIVYGRRKTGKTFLLRELCKFRNYFLIMKSVSVLHGEKTITIPELIKEVKELLAQGNNVVIDEFQRLDESILEEIVQVHPKGRLIVSGSSMRVVNRVFSSKSPVLGFFTPIRIGLIQPIDMIKGMSKLATEARVEFSAFLRDPWLIPLYYKEDILEFLFKVVTKSRYIITSLIGEIFSEEERELSKRYEAILYLIGSGVWSTQEITNIMYVRKLIPDSSPTHIIQYIKNLEEMELVEGIKLYKSKKRYFYRLKSPIMNLYYYLDSRYNIGEREISMEEAKPTLQKIISFEIQNYLANLFAEKYSGRKEYFISHSDEIDFIITARNKPIIVGEVKWKNISKPDIDKFIKSTEDFFCRKIILCKRGAKEKEIDVLDVNDILKLVLKPG